MNGQVISTEDKDIIVEEGKRVAVLYAIKGADEKEYVILDISDYLEIDQKYRTPIDRGFVEQVAVGDEVSFEFVSWKGLNVITGIVLKKLAKKIWY